MHSVARVVSPSRQQSGILCPAALLAATNGLEPFWTSINEMSAQDPTRLVSLRAFKTTMTTQTIAASAAQPFEPLLDSRDAAELLHIHHKTLERKAREGEIPGYKIAGRWYFRASELDGWLRSQLQSAPANPVRVN